jgi:hypothetical protein
MNYTYKILKIPTLDIGLPLQGQAKIAVYEKETGYHLEVNSDQLQLQTSSRDVPIEVKKRITDWLKSNHPELML